MLKYLLFLIIGIIIYALYNSVDGFSIGAPFNVGDKVVINSVLYTAITDIDGSIIQRTGTIAEIVNNNLYRVIFNNPDAPPRQLFDNFTEAQLTQYNVRLHNPIIINLRRFGLYAVLNE